MFVFQCLQGSISCRSVDLCTWYLTPRSEVQDLSRGNLGFENLYLYSTCSRTLRMNLGTQVCMYHRMCVILLYVRNTTYVELQLRSPLVHLETSRQSQKRLCCKSWVFSSHQTCLWWLATVRPNHAPDRALCCRANCRASRIP